MNALSYLQQLEQYRSQHQLRELSVSKVSVAWHLQHSLLVANAIIKLLAKSKADEYKAHFSFKKPLFFLLKYIPRQKAKAPKAVCPDESNVNLTDIDVLVKKVNERYRQLADMPSKAYFHHFYLGKMHKKQAINFIAIHTKHHIRIIQDIIAANNSS
jgi:hypothetical protein